MNRKSKFKVPVGWVVIIVTFLVWRQFGPGWPVETAMGGDQIAELFARKESGVMVEFDARISRILRDDEDGQPHQRFILELDNGHTVLVAHNLNLSSRVPIEKWDPIRVRGEYEWNAQGGVVHWTHRDPGAGLKHGWIEHKGDLYE